MSLTPTHEKQIREFYIHTGVVDVMEVFEELDATRKRLAEVERERDLLAELAFQNEARAGDYLIFRSESEGMVGWITNGFVFMRPLQAVREALRAEKARIGVRPS